MYNPSNDYLADEEEIEQCESNKAELIELRDLLKNRYPYLIQGGEGYLEYKRCYNKLYAIVVDILKDPSDDIDGKLWAFTFSNRCDKTKLNPDQVEDINQYANDFEVFNYEVKLVIEEIEQAIADKENKAKQQEEAKQVAVQANLTKKAQKAQKSNKIFDWDEKSNGTEQMYIAEAFTQDEDNQQL